jgi:hypothetical protein
MRKCRASVIVVSCRTCKAGTRRITDEIVVLRVEGSGEIRGGAIWA